MSEAINRFLSPGEAAAFLGGLNPRTVVRWAREGYLPSFPLGEGKRRLWRFLERDLVEWMLARRTGRAGTEPKGGAEGVRTPGRLALATVAPTGGFIR